MSVTLTANKGLAKPDATVGVIVKAAKTADVHPRCPRAVYFSLTRDVTAEAPRSFSTSAQGDWGF